MLSLARNMIHGLPPPPLIPGLTADRAHGGEHACAELGQRHDVRAARPGGGADQDAQDHVCGPCAAAAAGGWEAGARGPL